MTKRSSYGSWTGPIEYDAPEAEQDTTTPTESTQPATDDAKSWYSMLGVGTFLLGFVPGFQWAWAVTALCVVVNLFVAPVVGSLEASSKAKARSHGGGGCDVVIAGVILLVLAVGSFLFMMALAGGAV